MATYTPEFESWWKKVSAKQKWRSPTPNIAMLKRWAWKGWNARMEEEKLKELQRGQNFRDKLEKDRAAGIDITSPGYWGDFS